MRFIGAGASSIVFALSYEEASEWCDAVPAHLLRQLALRLSKRKALKCPTCCKALNDFIGFRLEVELSDEWKERCAAAYQPLCDCCKETVYAELVCNFSVSPSRIVPYSRVHGLEGMLAGDVTDDWPCNLTCAIEVKPKGLWRLPVVVGIVVDGREYYLHPVKMRQCRFSLMQLLKRKRLSRCSTSMPEWRSAYCPNQLLLGDECSIATALRRLGEHPANNLVVHHATNSVEGLDEESIRSVSSALQRSGIFFTLSNLQLYGSAYRCRWPVLDIELLFRWSEARDVSSVRWIVRTSDWEQSADVRCACQSDVTDSSWTTARCDSFQTSFVAPPMDFEECIRRFYTSVTAKDISVITTVTRSRLEKAPLKSPPESRYSASTSVVEEQVVYSRFNPQVEFIERGCAHDGVIIAFGRSQETLCRVGVVDVDAKWHKPLQHYFDVDCQILALWNECNVLSTA